MNRLIMSGLRRHRAVALQGPHCTVFAGPHDADHRWEMDCVEVGEKGAWALWASDPGRSVNVRASKRTTTAATRSTVSRSKQKAPVANESPYARVYRLALERRQASHNRESGSAE